VTAEERDRIRDAAIQRGRQERREQGIPERVESDAMTARLAALLTSEVVGYGDAGCDSAA